MKPSLPDLASLVGLFYFDPERLARFTPVAAEAVPQPYRKLLDHHEHMTVTVESYHGCPVDVEVLETRGDEQYYCRKILLRRRSDRRVVQFGIVRLLKSALAPEVLREIESQRVPLGRVLIEHDVMREVELAELWRVAPGPDLRRWFGEGPSDAPRRECYGRTALIYCNGEPAVELLEVVTPV